MLVLLASALCLPLTLAAGTRASSGGYLDDASESARAERLLEDDFRTGSSQLLLVLHADRNAGDADAQSVGRRLTAEVARARGVVYARSWWGTGDARLRSADGRTALVQVRLRGSDAQVERRAGELADRFSGSRPPFRITATGRGVVDADLAERSRRELVRAELVSMPLLALVLYLAFGSLMAAAIPLAVGVLCVTGTQAVLYGLTGLTQVSVFAPNLATALGLGLAIDYSIIMISRFREEREAGLAPSDAARAVSRITGRTVLCSAATVALSLSALLLVPLPFLRSLGAASVAVVVLACAVVLTFVPLVLRLFGRHLEFGRLRPRRHGTAADGAWHKGIGTVLRRPATVFLASTGVLVLLALPFLRVQWGLIDERWLPAGAPVRAEAEEVRRAFPLAVGSTPLVLLPSVRPGAPESARLAADLSRDPRVEFVSGPGGTYRNGLREDGRNARAAASGTDAQPPPLARTPAVATPPTRGTWFQVVTRLDPSSPAAQDLVRDIRSHKATGPLMVAGETAVLLDILHTLRDAAVRSAVIICAATGVLIAFFTRSLFIPLKALLTNLLSMTAGFGAMVFLFQEGRLAHWLGGTATGATDPLLPMLMFCIVFGVSMDYELFIVARIREEYLAHGDNRRAVATGLARTGRVVTASSIALVAAMAPLVASSVTVMQLLGTVLVIGVLVDATVVRCLLVPSAMTLAGRGNWWLPFRPDHRSAARPSPAGETA
ncbi:MMPL family transporter [Streptomyces lavendofoliae]|uniref:Membrane protein n=1 Tax=Streptomyces lavendofoliae TaxID=67314 RepID=A0A918M748_9ACTN|nr:MMPL family transporter [Streptomyces lavendofoliae]GGU58526.1 membrane protein [Streptomyces lavendofoliae]